MYVKKRIPIFYLKWSEIVMRQNMILEQIVRLEAELTLGLRTRPRPGAIREQLRGHQILGDSHRSQSLRHQPAGPLLLIYS